MFFLHLLDIHLAFVFHKSTQGSVVNSTIKQCNLANFYGKIMYFFK